VVSRRDEPGTTHIDLEAIMAFRDKSPLLISAVVMTKNEASVIVDCLTSLARFAQVFVVDSNSVDATPDLARANGATVVNFTWDGRYPKKKQWCLENLPIQHDWALFVDADERVSPQLESELLALDLAGSEFSAFEMPLEYYFLGQRLRRGHRVRKRSLVRVSETRFPEIDDLGVSNMWEVEGHYQPTAKGPVGRLRGSLLHQDTDSLYDYFARHNRYSDWEAFVAEHPHVAQQVNPQRTRLGRLAAGLRGRGLAFFLYSYVFRLGFMDGRAGFHYAIALAFYYWQIGVKRVEMLNLGHEGFPSERT